LHGAELIDLSLAPDEQKARRRRRALRIGAPILSVVLLIGAILGIALFTYESNRRGASVLSDDLLRSLEKRIGTEVAAYLAPAPKMAQFARQTLSGETFSGDGTERAGRFGRDVLHSYDQIASVYVADGNGQFLMIRRNAEGGTETKLITIGPDGTRRVRVSRHDALGQIVDEQDLQDDFDPRTRPWYQGAVNARDLYWTDVYVFFTERTPGVTAALPLVSADGGVAAVYGIDITLAALSRFLEGIEIGTTGRAMIVDAEGRLIAFPEPDRILRDDNGTLATRRLDELGDLALTRAFNRVRIEGHGHGTVEVDGERVIFVSTTLPIAVGKNWSVLIVVPEREIIGFVAANNRTSLLLSLSIIGIAALLAGLLVRQGIRADRNARLVRDRQEAIEAQSRAFAALADSAALFDPGDRRGTSALTESLADATAARRISVWRLAHGGRSLLCTDCFDREPRTHTAGVELHCAELPQVWAVLSSGEALDVADAARDSRTSGLFHAYLRPLGIQALMALPIKRGGEVIGSIWLEDLPSAAHRAAGVESFARTVAHMEAARAAQPLRSVSAAEEAPRPPPEEAQPPERAAEAISGSDEPRRDHVVPGTPASRRETAVDIGRQDILWQNRATADAVEVFPTVTILTIFLVDDSETGGPTNRGNAGAATIEAAGADTTAADAVARVLEDVAETHEIPYLKVLGNCVVAAAGFSGDAALAARAVARAALALRETGALRMGIDTGVAMGSPVGSGHHCYNLWGAAARRAAEMAQSAPLGGIQVTAFAYRHLTGEFLFRPRGGFYVHPEGETATYLLAGRL
jgi:adenylate cyclase